MTVRAKFKVISKDEAGNVTLETVYDPNPESENGKFFKWTPSGQIRMGILNPSALAQFVEGQEYYVDFSPMPDLVGGALDE